MASRMALRAPCMRQRTCGGGSGAGPCAGCHAPTAPYLTSGGNANAGARVHVQRPRLLQSGELARGRRTADGRHHCGDGRRTRKQRQAGRRRYRSRHHVSHRRPGKQPARAHCERPRTARWRRMRKTSAAGEDTQPSFEEQDRQSGTSSRNSAGGEETPALRGPLQRAAIAGTAIA